MSRTQLLTALTFALTLGFTAGCKPKAGDTQSGADSESQSRAVIHVDAIAASQLLAANADVIILDVRSPQEYAEGHLPGTVVNVDFRAAGFKDAVAKLDRSAPYLVHCQSGGRSTSALEILTELDFEKVYHLDGGVSGWTAAGEALAK